jgi:FkbM family methyltransferase
MIDLVIAILSWVIRRIPEKTPGKTRIGRLLLGAFRARKPAFLTDILGCSFVLPSYAEPMALEIFAFGTYESGTQRSILSLLSATGTFIDVGANIGVLAIPIAAQRPRSNVVCIEADPQIGEMLRCNLRRNRCANVRVVVCAAGPTDGRGVFYPAPDTKFGMGSLGAQFAGESIDVEQKTLDAILSSLGIREVDVIKIDVEGAELGVLRGAQKLLTSKNPPAVVFEFADWAEGRIPGQHPGDAQQFLLKHGYRLFKLDAARIRGDEIVAPIRSGGSMLVAVPARTRLVSNQVS